MKMTLIIVQKFRTIRRNENDDTNHSFRTIKEMKMTLKSLVQNNRRNENDNNHSFRTIKEMKMTLIISLEQ